MIELIPKDLAAAAVAFPADAPLVMVNLLGSATKCSTQVQITWSRVPVARPTSTGISASARTVEPLAESVNLDEAPVHGFYRALHS